MFAVDRPAFEAIVRSEAIKNLKSLPPGILDHVAEQVRKFNSRPDDDIDEAEAHRIITELTFVYFLLPVVRADAEFFREYTGMTDEEKTRYREAMKLMFGTPKKTDGEQ